MQTTPVYITALLCLVLSFSAYGQTADSVGLYAKVYSAPDKFFGAIYKRSAGFENKLSSTTHKYLHRLKKKEHKLKRKLMRVDATAAQELFGKVDERYDFYSDILQDSSSTNIKSQVYSGHLDSMIATLSFLKQSGNINNAVDQSPHLQEALIQFKHVQDKLTQSHNIEQLLLKRQNDLKSSLLNSGLGRQYRRLQQDVYYYRASIDEYREIWENPSKMEAKVLELAQKVPAFKDFFAKYSMLGQLFPMPITATAGTVDIPGLQSREMVTTDMINRFGSQQQLSQQASNGFGSARTTIDQVKHKVESLGNSGEGIDMPNFKPDQQKTKSIWKRIEVGTNLQNVKGSTFFPVTSDFGLSVGYKISDNTVAGIGASYKLGWGSDYRNIRLSHEGVGLRSFVDIKLKGSFFATGGFEYNYQQPFENFRQFDGFDSWQQSGLVGISKIVSLKTKYFRKTKMQVLWDFLSYHQFPKRETLKFRIGYSF